MAKILSLRVLLFSFIIVALFCVHFKPTLGDAPSDGKNDEDEKSKKNIKDMDPDAPLRIGVKFRPPTCPSKSKPGDTLVMHYVGTLRKDGKVFDSSRGRGQPFRFQLGGRQVIEGWERGLVNMCVGEKRKLTIPSNLGYGDAGAPPRIPGKATLIFEVELLEIIPVEENVPDL